LLLCPNLTGVLAKALFQLLERINEVIFQTAGALAMEHQTAVSGQAEVGCGAVPRLPLSPCCVLCVTHAKNCTKFQTCTGEALRWISTNKPHYAGGAER